MIFTNAVTLSLMIALTTAAIVRLLFVETGPARMFVSYRNLVRSIDARTDAGKLLRCANCFAMWLIAAQALCAGAVLTATNALTLTTAVLVTVWSIPAAWGLSATLNALGGVYGLTDD
jgi:hypothetical protein